MYMLLCMSAVIMIMNKNQNGFTPSGAIIIKYLRAAVFGNK